MNLLVILVICVSATKSQTFWRNFDDPVEDDVSTALSQPSSVLSSLESQATSTTEEVKSWTETSGFDSSSTDSYLSNISTPFESLRPSDSAIDHPKVAEKRDNEVLVDSTTLDDYSTTDAALSTVSSTESTEISCVDPPSIESLDVNVTSPNVILEWIPLETDACLKEYVIYVDDLEKGRTQDLSFVISDLEACSGSEYIVAVAVSYGEDLVGPRTERRVTLDVPEREHYYPYLLRPSASENYTGCPTGNNIDRLQENAFSYTVEHLTLTPIEYHVLNVTWSISQQVAKCVTGYYLVYWDQGGKSKDVTISSTFYQISPIIGCMEYNVQVIPLVTEAIQGPPEQGNYVSDPLPTNPPKKISVEIGTTYASITWGADSYATNMCNITSFTITCEALEANNEDKTWIVRNRDVTQKVQDTASRLISVDIDELSEFTNYTCYGYVENTGGRSNASEVVFFRTLPNEPSAPEPVEIINVSSTSFTVTWTEPEKVPGILTQYVINIENMGPKHYVGHDCLDLKTNTFELDANIYSYTFEDAHPNFQYSVSIFGTVLDAGNGTSAMAETLTEIAVPPPPADLRHISHIDNDAENLRYNVTLEIVWEGPCNTNGPLKGFQLTVDGFYQESDRIESRLADSASYFIPKHELEQEAVYKFNLSDIKNSYLYTVNVSTVLNVTDFEGEPASITVLSPDGYPGPPLLDGIVNTTNQSFALIWSTPLEKFGQILEYEITIENLGPLYEVPKDGLCKIKNGTNTTIVDAHTLNYTYEDGLPYYNYSLYVRARTSAGYGARSNELFAVTEQSEPEEVRFPVVVERYAQTENYDGIAFVSFTPPCKMNGEFLSYHLSYHGARTNHPPHEQSVEMTKVTTYNMYLKPEYEYTVNIQVVTEHFSSPSFTHKFRSHPGVPPLVDSLEPPVSNLTTTAHFKFSKSAFNDSNGDILYYALFILPNNVNLTGNSYGFWNGTDNGWPGPPQTTHSGSFEPYQLTEVKWYPFQDSDIIEFRIGTENSCSSNIKCNKLLEDDTPYILIARGLTSMTYRDSSPLEFRTLAHSLDIGLILGIVLGLLTAAVLIIFVVILWRRKKRTFIEEETEIISATEPGPINVKKFPAHYEFVKDNYNVIKAQFSTLAVKSKEFDLPITYAVLPENKRKNRYSNILPYDETRVKLLIDEDDEISSDYINASYIKGYSNKAEYIATQGPLETTAKDFWKMVLQENVSIIMMVSNFVEQSREKCFKYFPNNHESAMFGDNLEVRCSTELHFGTYCMRTLQVKRDTLQRTVTHIQFLEWPDFGVPLGTENMLNLCYQMRDRIKAEGGIIVVHCSAGVGRTGTLIAVDILLQTMNDHRDINIFKTVLDLRQQRMNMVQTEKQYMFIYTCLRDALEGPPEQTYVRNEEPLYENLSTIKSSLEDNLIPTESESAL